MQWLASLIHAENGNVAVEFGLVLPIFLVFMLGIADYGRATTARSELDAAARAGLQVLVRDATDTTAAHDAAQDMAPDADVSAAIACSCADGTNVSCATGTCPIGVPRRIATIAVTQDIALLFPWPYFGESLALEATAVGRLK